MPHPIATINPSLLQDPTGAFYSHISAVAPGAQLLYTAGQVGSDKNGKVPDSLEAQARQVYANIKTCLTEAGATIRNIVHLTTYIVDYDAASCPIWEAYKEFLTDQHGTYLPPGTLVPVSKLAAPDFKIEVQCVAAVNPPTPNTGTGVGKTVPSSTINVDVVVVGAGLSGLAAATEVQGAGLSCVVLEAKDRVGGKTQSVAMSQGPGVLDVGAAWINDTTQPKMYALHKKFGCEPLVQRTTGDQVFSEGKSNKISRVLGTDVLPLEEEQQRFFDQMWSDLDEDANKIDLYNSAANTHIPDISLGAYLRSKGGVGTALQMWTLSVRALTGCEPDDISLVYFLDYVKSGGGLGSLLTESSEGAQYLRNRNGNIFLASDDMKMTDACWFAHRQSNNLNPPRPRSRTWHCSTRQRRHSNHANSRQLPCQNHIRRDLSMSQGPAVHSNTVVPTYRLYTTIATGKARDNKRDASRCLLQMHTCLCRAVVA
jgi:monoamine oxidase